MDHRITAGVCGNTEVEEGDTTWFSHAVAITGPLQKKTSRFEKIMSAEVKLFLLSMTCHLNLTTEHLLSCAI